MNKQIHLNIHLKYYRELNKYSQSDIAKYLNLSRQAVSRWESGLSYPDIDNLILLAQLYNITVDELLGGVSTNVPDDKELTLTKSVLSQKQSNVITKETSIFSLEFICLAVLLVLSAQFAFIGITASIAIAFWCFKHKRNYKLIYILCIVCFFISLDNSIALVEHTISDFGTATIIPMSD